MIENAIVVCNLRKSYGRVCAVAGVDLSVRVGEVFALLGPNGAGKTTTVEILEGFQQRDSGTVTIFGYDPGSNNPELKSRMGIVSQETATDPFLTVIEMVEMMAGAFPRARPAREVVALVGLTEKKNIRVGRLSGGQKRRLDVAMALVGDPDLLFLDEPTTGFDPEARNEAWELVRNLRSLGKTVLLTTHYMEEAQQLADRVAVIADGRIIAEGPPDTLGGRAEARTRIRFRLSQNHAPLPCSLQKLLMSSNNDFIDLHTDEPVSILHTLTEWSLQQQVDLTHLEVSRPSLEETYRSLIARNRTTIVEEL